MDIQKILSEITPFYNKYKQNNNKNSGADVLELMWDVGSILNEFIQKQNIKPHRLFWMMYGKSEGKIDIIQKSYITREFLQRSFRIRKIFSKKEEIKKLLPNLESYTIFREAMPFIDNTKYKFVGEEKEKLIELMNSNLTSRIILEKIKKIKNSKINIKNPRNQRLHELNLEKKIFESILFELQNYLKLNRYSLVKEILNNKNISNELCLILSRNISALTEDGLKFFDINNNNEVIDDVWKEFIFRINNLIHVNDVKVLRRFRRIFPPEKLMKLARMLYSLISEENYINYIS